MSKRSQEHLLEFYEENSSGDTAPLVLSPIADQSDANGIAITPLDVTASFFAGNGNNPEYSAILPVGLVIDSATGIISGTPTVVSTIRAQVKLKTTNGVSPPNKFGWTIT